MTNTLRLKTNLNCNSCVAAVKPYLDTHTRYEGSSSKAQIVPRHGPIAG